MDEKNHRPSLSEYLPNIIDDSFQWLWDRIARLILYHHSLIQKCKSISDEDIHEYLKWPRRMSSNAYAYLFMQQDSMVKRNMAKPAAFIHVYNFDETLVKYVQQATEEAIKATSPARIDEYVNDMSRYCDSNTDLSFRNVPQTYVPSSIPIIPDNVGFDLNMIANKVREDIESQLNENKERLSSISTNGTPANGDNDAISPLEIFSREDLNNYVKNLNEEKNHENGENISSSYNDM